MVPERALADERTLVPRHMVVRRAFGPGRTRRAAPGERGAARAEPDLHPKLTADGFWLHGARLAGCGGAGADAAEDGLEQRARAVGHDVAGDEDGVAAGGGEAGREHTDGLEAAGIG